MRIRFLLSLIFIFLLLSFNGRTAAQEPLTYVIQPGDSWTALAWRFQTTAEELQALNPHLNQQRQPTIGDPIQLPFTATSERHGRLTRPREKSLFDLSLHEGINPWQWALQTGTTNPYRPFFGQALFLEGGEQPPHDWPPYFDSLELSAIPAYPGEGLALRGTLTAALPEAAHLTLGTESGDLISNGNRIVGLVGTGAFFNPGAPELSIRVGDELIWSQPWRIAADKPWTYNQITLSGTAAEISQEDIAAERARLFELWSQVTPAPQWTTPFQEPIKSYLDYSSLYGARRSYDGGPYSTYHEGLDFAAYGGTEVYAPAGGTVVVAEELYVRGGAVIIDHGLGIYSGVYHMSDLLVTAGDVVTAGQLVGKVGSTGFSTGNHLHWDLLVSGTWVDPMAWRVNNTACWLAAGWGTPCQE